MTTHTLGSSGAEPSGEATPEPVQAHIDRIAREHRPLVDRLHRLIRAAQPDAHPGISYGMLCYRAGARRLYLGAWKRPVHLRLAPRAENRAHCPPPPAEDQQGNPAAHPGHGSRDHRSRTRLADPRHTHRPATLSQRAVLSEARAARDRGQRRRPQEESPADARRSGASLGSPAGDGAGQPPCVRDLRSLR